ncbi:cytochrome b [Mariprofundus erugo]|uniref:cytochrome b/b6 domain-containing protein n=1 Tax=Mariprofundus erugo TaxID=2528639 RepID=UPI0010FE897A|nr:cytochrome b/b6 domain-containing protein [Mariprofundus erugo]TLS76678.1 cytochrome b [Mariprofundus erugo]
MREKMIEVWDLSLRLFHWLLATAFFVAWWAEGRDIRLHIIAGSVIAGLLLYRVVWGFVGEKHALFKMFRPTWSMLVGHAGDLIRLQAARYIGHTPIGSLMIYMLLLSLLVLVVSGMALLGLQMGVGLFSPWASSASFETEILLQQIHGWCLDLLQYLIAMHLAGVVVESLLQRRNLTLSMITGRKEKEEAIK